MPRAPNLWKPETAHEKPDYITCATGLCKNLVAQEGDHCPEHQPDRDPIERAPSNHRFF